MQMHWLYPAREGTAEEGGQFRHSEVEKGALALGFQRGGMVAAEIGLDLRPPERAQLIAGGSDAVGVPKNATVRLELFGIGERDEQLIRKTERQAACGLRLLRQSRREQSLILGEHRGRQRDD